MTSVATMTANVRKTMSRAVGEVDRQCERGDEGDRAADPDPREQRRPLPGRIRVVLADRRGWPSAGGR